MKIQSLFIVCLTCCWLASCNSSTDQTQNINTVVFQSREEGYSHYRIPALIKSEHLLYAFAEARKNSANDNGNINIVLKRSHDWGKSWEGLIHVLDSPDESVQNPTPIYIPEDNRILLLFTKRTVGSDTEHMIRDGSSEGYVGVYISTSMDEGLTWSIPREITQEVKREDWNWYAVGPGGAITMKYNRDYEDRIIIPANHSLNKGSSNDQLGAHVIYSDDKGDSWSIGAIDSKGKGLINPNETAVVELNDGTLYFNTRNHSSADTIAHRAYAISIDGGQSFTHPFTHEKELITPIVHASLCRNSGSLFFIGPNHKNERKNLSIWQSDAANISWELVEQVQNGFSAYSSALFLKDDQLGIMVETDDYSKILYKTVQVIMK